jgi:hypothetical protein
MPLNAKGREILSSMRAQYPTEKKAKQVFYASRNKGTITGVDPESSGPRRAMFGKKKK